MIDFYTTDPRGKQLLGLLVAVLLMGVAVGAIGLIRNWNGFAENLAAELVGLLVTTAVGFLLVDGLVRLRDERRREQEWSKVRNTTLAAIAAHVCQIGLYLSEHLHYEQHAAIEPHLKMRDPSLRAPVAAFDELAAWLRGIDGTIDEDASYLDRADAFCLAAQSDFSHIATVLLPRVIQSSQDQSLIESLFEFDAAYRLLNTVALQYGEPFVRLVPSLVLLAQASGDLYHTLCDSFDR